MLKHPKVLDFHIDDPRWRHIPHICAKLEQASVLTLSHLPKAQRFPCKITLMLSKDAAIRKLNHDFRGMDKPTNVLSFPQFAPDQLAKFGKQKTEIHVGDIAISYQYVVAEAKEQHKILINHVVHLMIHGILHLFGYDHASDAEAERMEKLEKKVMDELGLPDPYLVIDAPKPKTKLLAKSPTKRVAKTKRPAKAPVKKTKRK